MLVTLRFVYVVERLGEHGGVVYGRFGEIILGHAGDMLWRFG